MSGVNTTLRLHRPPLLLSANCFYFPQCNSVQAHAIGFSALMAQGGEEAVSSHTTPAIGFWAM